MLIKQLEHDVGMFGYVLIVLLVIVGPLAYFAGVDSRIDEKSRRRRFTG
ncbi:MAG: hypothetical protein H0U05_00145 [Actinobacteria bacterium]|nr:hypothetical protein [Actinomycetota bacterium]